MSAHDLPPRAEDPDASSRPGPAARHPDRPVARSRTVVRLGLDRGHLGDLYHFLLATRWRAVLLLIGLLYIAVNALFAVAYLTLGDAIENARPGSFADAFFFSVQTMATLGYGKMVPRGTLANVLVSAEALVGLLGLAMATGLIFAKFSRPTARVLFSRVAVVASHEGLPTLMLRLANARGNQIVEAQLRLILVRRETTAEGDSLRRLHDLRLLRSSTAFFALTWTAFHPITPDSPLYGATRESLRESEAEIIASVVGMDETFSDTVHARWSYLPDEVLWNARFADILSRTPDGRLQVDYGRFHDALPLGDSS